MQPSFFFEDKYQNLVVAGIDEAGRGPIAGPVVASCVILDRKNFPIEINDSKKISRKKRQKLFLEICENAKFGIGIVNHDIIDEINILNATKLAMKIAYQNLCKENLIYPQAILVDGNFIPFDKTEEIRHFEAIISGDQKSFSIAAASIIAKETRDKIMEKIHEEYPQFGFNQHFGYPTKSHKEAIRKYQFCKYHRLSFNGVLTN